MYFVKEWYATRVENYKIEHFFIELTMITGQVMEKNFFGLWINGEGNIGGTTNHCSINSHLGSEGVSPKLEIRSSCVCFRMAGERMPATVTEWWEKKQPTGMPSLSEICLRILNTY